MPPKGNVTVENHDSISQNIGATATNRTRTKLSCIPSKIKKARGLKIAHLNVCSLRNKVDQLQMILHDQIYDVFAVTETWLSTDILDCEVDIDGYDLYRRDRDTRGGGVAIYVKSSISHEVCVEFNAHADIEALWIKITSPHTKPVFICCIYRPPSADLTYYETMLNHFEYVMANDNDVIILGDFNFNYEMNESLANNPAHYIELLLNCTQLIHEPTRVTPETSRTIDLIYTSLPERHAHSGVVKCTLSDHYLIYTIIDYRSKLNKTGARSVTVRDFKKFDILAYNNALMDCNLLGTVDKCSGINDAWESWSKLVKSTMDHHAPLKTHRVKNRSNPWVTRELLLLMYERDDLHKRAIKSKKQDDYEQYRSSRNGVVKAVRKAKKEYYTEQITQSRGTKHMWKTLRGLLKSKSGSTRSPPINADDFNTFFTNIGPKLNSKFPTDMDFHWTQPDCVHSFKWNDINEDRVYADLCALSSDSNLDVLGFDSKLLRAGADVLVSSLTNLFNMSIEYGCIPSDFKKARVTPVYKGKGASDEPSNYRPISVVPHVAKLLEKCIQTQLLDYLDEHKLITCDQSAFRKYHSTQTAVHKMVDDFLDNINEGYINGACFFDLAKCFDTIDHEILLSKLERYGIRGKALNWFTDYLTDRSQVVRTDNQLSSLKDISTGVPQGSVLGPILFLIFINDLPSCLTCTMCNIFADDTEIHACGSSLDEVQGLLQRDADNLTDWFYRNKLTVNGGKSFSMVFSSNPNVDKCGLCLDVDNTRLTCVPSARYLGVFPDSDLKWSEHVNKLCNTISPKVGLLRKLKRTLPIECVKLVYKSTIQTHIDYCLTTWGFAPAKYLDKVQRLQNRAARIVTGNYSWNVRGTDLVSELGWQNVTQRRDYFTALLVFKALHGMAPVYIQDMFTYSREVNSRLTRHSAENNLYVPKISKNLYSQSLHYNGAKIWNSLPSHFKVVTSLDTFKRMAKEHFSPG